ncbi:Maltokinase [bacterium HR29]|jgi:maltokinase|nr:Maltokinase [bacterium HR29]
MTPSLLAVPGAPSLNGVLGGDHRPLVEALERWLPPQRWFPAKLGTLHRAEIAGWCPLDGHARAAVVLVRCETGDPEPLWLQLVLGLTRPGTAQAAIVEGVAQSPALHAIARFVTGGGTAEGPGLRLESEWEAEPAALRPRTFAAEQSNSSLRLGNRALVKLYRRIRFGPNPEVELLRYLGGEAGFAGAPRFLGAGRGQSSGGSYDAWVAQELLPRAADGWSWFLARLRTAGTMPRSLVREARSLGELTGMLHIALARARGPGLTPQPAGRERFAEAAAAEADGARRLAAVLAEAGHDPTPIEGAVRALERWRPPEGSLGLAIRIHGDYHLGQVLRSRRRWYVSDFEGEPARPLEERRSLQSPLADVAGMLRSFDYLVRAAQSAGSTADEGPLRASFLTGYRESAGTASNLLPTSPAFEQLLTFFELRKALYEVRYEADNRPSWVSIPLAAVARLAEALA